jgi:hypothetical protein
LVTLPHTHLDAADDFSPGEQDAQPVRRPAAHSAETFPPAAHAEASILTVNSLEAPSA